MRRLDVWVDGLTDMGMDRWMNGYQPGLHGRTYGLISVVVGGRVVMVGEEKRV